MGDGVHRRLTSLSCFRGQFRIPRQSAAFMTNVSACGGMRQEPCPAFCLAVLSAGSFPSRKGEMVFSGMGQKLTGPLGSLFHWPLVDFACLPSMSLSP